MEQNEQEAIYKFSIFERQIKEIQQQIEAVEKGIVELSSLGFGLEDLVGASGKEIFAPIGKGIFAHAKLISEQLSVDIGDGNIVRKSIPETRKLIEEQVSKLEQVREELGKNLEEIEKEMTDMVREMQEKNEE